MKKPIKWVVWMLVISLLLSGCVMRTVDELYCLPKRTKADNDLQSVIDSAMTNLSYCAPLNGEKRQTVQSADLDGDGVDEYVVLARNNSTEPLKILVFFQLASGYALMDTISAYGFGFDLVEFSNVDDRPGAEIIVGRQVGDGVVRSLAVYSVYSGVARELLSANYSRVMVQDMDEDGRGELMLLHPSAGSDRTCTVLLYRFQDKQLQIGSQMELPYALNNIKAMEGVTLRDGTPAMMIAAAEKNLQYTHLWNMRNRQLNQVFGPAPAEKLDDRFVPPMDVDLDGDVDIPELVPVRGTEGSASQENWVLWYDVDVDGKRYDGMYTYYNYLDQWYLHLDSNWTRKLTVTGGDGITTFSNFDNEMVLSIHTITGERRAEQAKKLGLTVLDNNSMVLYGAKLGERAADFGITEQRMTRLFYILGLNFDEQGD